MNYRKKSKKGVSEIVSYVILIVIAVGLSVLVYGYLKKLANPPPEFCEEDIQLVVDSYNCTISAGQTTVALDFKNKGLFKVDAVFVRMGNQSKEVLQQINRYQEYLTNSSGSSVVLQPGEVIRQRYITSDPEITDSGDYKLEIQPATRSKKGLALCDKAVIAQTISCISVT